MENLRESVPIRRPEVTILFHNPYIQYKLNIFFTKYSIHIEILLGFLNAKPGSHFYFFSFSLNIRS